MPRWTRRPRASCWAAWRPRGMLPGGQLERRAATSPAQCDRGVCEPASSRRVHRTATMNVASTTLRLPWGGCSQSWRSSSVPSWSRSVRIAGTWSSSHCREGMASISTRCWESWSSPRARSCSGTCQAELRELARALWRHYTRLGELGRSRQPELRGPQIPSVNARTQLRDEPRKRPVTPPRLATMQDTSPSLSGDEAPKLPVQPTA